MPLFKKPENDISLIFDIGSGSVGAALAKLSPDGIPHILYALREPIPFQERLSSERLPILMLAALASACQTLQKEGLPLLASHGTSSGNISEALIAFSPPWYLSETHHVAVEKMKPFAFTREVAEEALSKEAGEFESREDVDKAGAAALDREAISVTLDGYITRKPYGRRVLRAEISAYLSFVPKTVLADVHAAITRSFSPKEIALTAFPLIQYRVLREKSGNTADFVMIDVSRELTEVSLVKKDVLEETFSFPIGKNHLIREAMKELNTTPEAARSELKMHFTGVNTEEHSARIEAAIARVRERWNSSFAEALETLSNSHYLPALAYLLAQPDMISFFKASIGGHAPTFPALGEDRALTALDAEFFKGKFTKPENADVDPFLIIAAIFCNMRFANPDLGL